MQLRVDHSIESIFLCAGGQRNFESSFESSVLERDGRSIRTLDEAISEHSPQAIILISAVTLMRGMGCAFGCREHT